MRFNIKEWQDKNVNRITESLEKNYEGEEDTHLAFYTLLSWDGTSDAKFADCLKDSWWKKLRAQAN